MSSVKSSYIINNNNNNNIGWRKIFEWDRYLYDIDYNDSFTNIHLSSNSASSIHYLRTKFVC